jgi:hypothetical protein
MPFRRHSPLSLALAAALAVAPLQVRAQTAPAEPTQTALPLPAGEAAGVKKAQGFSFDRVPWVFIAGFGIVAVAVLLGLNQSNSSSATD